MSTGQEDRRRHPRYDSRVEIEGVPEEGGVFAKMHTENLSLGGVYCSSTQDYPEMTRLAVRLRLPAGDRRISVATVDAEAVVVRREVVDSVDGETLYRLALFFTGMDDSNCEVLSRYLATLD